MSSRGATTPRKEAGTGPMSPGNLGSNVAGSIRNTRWGELILVCYAVLLMVRLGQPAGYIHDEAFQAFTAHRYVLGDQNAWDPLEPQRARKLAEMFRSDDMTQFTTYEWAHPPTAKLLMAAAIAVFGFFGWAYRLPGVICGLVIAFVTWRLASRLYGARVGLVALLLATTDGGLFVLSRVAMNDIYVTAGLVSALYCAYRSVEPTELARGVTPKQRRFWVWASALLFGIALSSKWNAAALYLATAVALMILGQPFVERAKFRVAVAVSFVLVPPVVYLAAYLPYFLQGHTLDDLLDLHRNILWFHQNLKETHSQSSRFWEWPLLLQPVWFYANYDTVKKTASLIFAMGNPLLWWLMVPAQLLVAYRWVRQRKTGDGLLLFAFCGVWLPWAFVSRVAFLTYFIPAVPFGIIAVARGAVQVGDRLRLGWLPWAYASVCLLVLVNFYPMWTAWPVDVVHVGEQRRWFWLPRWVPPGLVDYGHRLDKGP